MRGKKAKELRAMARTLTGGMPMVEYLGGSPPYLYTDDKHGMRVTAPGVPLSMKFSCTRAAYQMLKKK